MTVKMGPTDLTIERLHERNRELVDRKGIARGCACDRCNAERRRRGWPGLRWAAETWVWEGTRMIHWLGVRA